MDILQELRQNESLTSVPESELQWLVDHSEIVTLEEGEYLYKKGDPVDHLLIVLAGRLRMFIDRNGQHRELGFNEVGYIGGLLPYSRMKTGAASGVAVEKTTALRLPRAEFREMISSQYQLVESFVHLMLDRTRDYTKLDQQNEKMISLGKLSAGLAHELNNPAAAVVRSASALKKHLGFVPEKFKSVISIQATGAQVDRVNEILGDVLKRGTPDLTLIEKSALEDDLYDWLEEHEVDNGFEIAECFAEYGVTTDDLEGVSKQVLAKDLSAVLDWLNNVLTTEKMVNEIAEASERIGNLVKSIKDYSHMDGGADKKMVVLRDGVESTLRILQHKLKTKHIKVQLDIPDSLPKVCMSPGEMNQVWTNLIDNAIDALPEAGEIRIESEQDREFVITKVIDNGSGIPQDVIDQIFDPFFTTKEIGKGSGLGLEIAQNIIKRHRGQIKVSSKPGHTEFNVCLPIE
ncbi:cyclic nucleotide-binding domain-containing protein [Cytophagaceae bacterium SJW1-29]|uniref:histidine kinase n=1 Tax=Salmonirosea aquatica TaxID=2654236 RepID=A0A7C9FPZ3_9BACT|nr:cyclic nucleotide-binding domain-containing protein [Cytophagaceae bacterium SJW1-29]